jgi:Acyl-CoA dehydrogenase, C-terminal domain
VVRTAARERVGRIEELCRLEELGRIEELGRTAGLACGLRAILADGRPVPRGASGLALIPADDAEPAREAAATGPAGSLAEAAGLRVTRLAPPPRQSQDTDTYTGTDTDTETAILLAAVRLGVTARLLDLAIEHLTARQVEGAPLTDKQLIQVAVAEAAASLELCRRGLSSAGTLAAAEQLHERLAETGWSVVTLFGASGFLREHAALQYYAAELVHDAWTAPIGVAA